MKPAHRLHLAHLAFLPMTRTTDRRAEWYLRQIDLLTREPIPPTPPHPRWHLILEAVAVWTLVVFTVIWLAHRYGWIA